MRTSEEEGGLGKSRYTGCGKESRKLKNSVFFFLRFLSIGQRVSGENQRHDAKDDGNRVRIVHAPGERVEIAAWWR